MWWPYLSLEVAGEFAHEQRRPHGWRACMYMQESVVRYYSHVAAVARHRALAEREHKATQLRVWRWRRRVHDPVAYADELRRNREGAQKHRRVARAERMGELRCAECDQPMRDSGTGRRREYCSTECKRRARRRREKADPAKAERERARNRERARRKRAMVDE